MKFEDRTIGEPRRFVLLQHVIPALAEQKTHWDLMLDQGQDLLTFQLKRLPRKSGLAQIQELPVRRLPNHRRVYLEFEGELSGGRGYVGRLAWGTATIHDASPPAGIRVCQLVSENLTAEFTFHSCNPGDTTLFVIKSWQQNWQ